MTTNARSRGGDAHDLYVAKIHNLIAQGRDSLIASLVAEYEQVGHTTAQSRDSTA